MLCVSSKYFSKIDIASYLFNMMQSNLCFLWYNFYKYSYEKYLYAKNIISKKLRYLSSNKYEVKSISFMYMKLIIN